MKVLGHRGASALLRENSIAALQRAFDDGADGVELDARLCASGELVVAHDPRLERLYGDPRPIWKVTLPEIRRVAPDLATLDEAWDAVGARGIVNVEVKSRVMPFRRAGGADAGPPWRSTAEAARRWARVHGLHQRPGGLLFSSFDPRIVAWLAVGAAGAPRALLHETTQRYPIPPWTVARLMRCAAVHPEHPLATPEYVTRAHALGLRVNAWTVDDPGDLERVRAAGVDAVVANDPGKARAILSGQKSRS